MDYLDKPFEVSTGSGRRPTPTTFEHLRGYVALVKQFLKITNVTELTDINEILNQTASLYISNEISRVIAQLAGETPLGFETIQSTVDGALHVYPVGGTTPGYTDIKIEDGDDEALGAIADAIVAAGAVGTISAKLRRLTQGIEDLKSLLVLASGSNLIGRVQVQGLSHTVLTAPINIATIATHDIIAAVGSVAHHITSICFTVEGEVDLTLRDETGAFTGVMDFGAEGEPKGMTHTHELTPLKCHVNEKFQITLGHAIQVSGYVTYYDA